MSHSCLFGGGGCREAGEEVRLGGGEGGCVCSGGGAVVPYNVSVLCSLQYVQLKVSSAHISTEPFSFVH